MRNCCPTHFERPHGEIDTSSSSSSIIQYGSMRGDNSMNTSSLVGKERAQKASEVRRKNGQIF